MLMRKNLVLAITAGLMIGMSACSMRETAEQRPEAQVGKDDAAVLAKTENEGRRQNLRDERKLAEANQLEAIEITQLEPPPPPPPSREAPKEASAQISTAAGAVAVSPMPMPTPNPTLVSPFNTENYATDKDNGVMRVAEQPVSTFSIDVDTGSYSNVRRMLNQGQLPPADAVRAEEFINYFDYAYTAPTSRTTPFAVHTEIAPAPWNAKRHLFLVGIKGYEIAAAEIPAANLVFLIDSSGSMASPDKIELLKQSFKQMVPKLRAQDRISIVVYAGSAGLVLPPTSGADHATILAALDQLAAGGSTNGGAGIELAYATAQQAFIKNGVNRVILATDGDFNVGTVDTEALKTIVAEKRKGGVSLTTLGFGQDNYNDELSEQLADIGNGNHAYIDTLNEGHKVLVEEMSSTLFTIAKDVKIQVEFNPQQVAEYRLIGYSNRMLAREDFNNDQIDAGEIGAGHDVTAIYELALVGSGGEQSDPLRYGKAEAKPGRGAELAHLKLRYKQPDAEVSKLIDSPILASEVRKAASPRLQFAAAVAAFADRLRGGEHLGTFDLAAISKLATAARNEDRFGYQREFIDLVNRAQTLSGEATPVAVVAE